MYNNFHFKASGNEEVIAFMKAHPFIVLCGTDIEGKPVATHVPVIIEEREGKLMLLAHVMRKQDHTIAFEENANVLAIFLGAHSYISASWYDTKNIASTWNYQAVHAKGILRFLDEKGLHNLLINLTDHFEGNPHSPASVYNMDETYVSQMMKAITAFEIEITHLDHIFKLSQNKDAKTFDNIVTHLSSRSLNDKAVADKMKEHQNKTFNRRG